MSKNLLDREVNETEQALKLLVVTITRNESCTHQTDYNDKSYCYTVSIPFTLVTKCNTYIAICIRQM